MISKSKNKVIFFAILATACIVTPMFTQGKVERLDYEAIETFTLMQILDKWFADGNVFVRFYKESITEGTINGIEATGYLELYFFAKTDTATGDMNGHGKITFYVDWNGLTGSFAGILTGKKVAGVMEMKMILQGASGDYIGWKFFGLVENLDPGHNIITGEILIPK